MTDKAENRREWVVRTEIAHEEADRWWREEAPSLGPVAPLRNVCVHCDVARVKVWAEMNHPDIPETLKFCEPCFWEIEQNYPHVYVTGGFRGGPIGNVTDAQRQASACRQGLDLPEVASRGGIGQ